MEDEGDARDGHSSVSDEIRDEPAKDMAQDFHDLQSGDRRGVLVLQVVRDYVLSIL